MNWSLTQIPAHVCLIIAIFLVVNSTIYLVGAGFFMTVGLILNEIRRFGRNAQGANRGCILCIG